MSCFSEIAIDLETNPNFCEDCERVLHPGNTTVSYDAAFWANAKWSDETRCSTCKADREADGPSDGDLPHYDGYGYEGYRQQMVDAGRAHLL